MGKKKRIGILMAQPDSPYQMELLDTILSEAFANRMDAFVFSSFIKYATPLYMKGEESIYHMVSCQNLDGLLIVPDTLRLTGVAEQIQAGLQRNFPGPVVSVDYESPYYPSVLHDDCSDIRRIVDHLIEMHGYTDIAFLTGPKGHPHAENRLEGYRSSLFEHHLPVDESHIFYGDFWYRDGERVVDALLHMDKMPQAIACACDTMAISVCDALKLRGLRIPDDIAVTGYDALGTGIRTLFSVTSMCRSVKNMGRRAVTLLMEQIEHRNKTAAQNFPREELILQPSCGCSPQNHMDLYGSVPDGRRGNVYDHVQGFFSSNNFMLEDIIGAEDLKDCLWKIDWYTNYIKGFEHFYLCLCSNWVDKTLQDPLYSEEMLLVYHKYRRDEGVVSLDYRFPLSEMLPGLESSQEDPSVYYFTPLHFSGIPFGYAAISYQNSAMVYPDCYSSFIRNINNALESQRRQIRLRNISKKMEEYAVIDQLTGVYNRNGLYLYSGRILSHAGITGKKLLAIVGDMNGLKYINDHFGHSLGDLAIQSAAKAFQKALSPNDPYNMAFRTGGDEFLLLSAGEYTEQQIQKLLQDISENLAGEAAALQTAFPLSISLGIHYGPAGGTDSIERFIADADRRMFRNKREYRKSVHSGTKQSTAEYNSSKIV